MISPFLIEVFDNAFEKQGQLGSYSFAEFVPSHNEIGTWTIKLPLSSTKMVELLADPNRRIKVTYRGNFLMSGPVAGLKRTRTGKVNEIQVTGVDDLVWLAGRLAFPNPGGVIPGNSVVFTQTTDYDVRSGNGESVIKGFVSAAQTRLPIAGLTVATNLNRGTNTKQAARMDQVLVPCLAAATASGLGVQVQQVASGLVLDVYVPQTQAVRLSERLGNLQAWEYVVSRPAATRVVVGGRGEGSARRYVKETLSSSETAWGIVEAFVDGSDLDLDTDLSPRGQEFLAENAPTAGFSITPNDTASMAFGTHYGLGDQVMVEVADGVQVTDTVKRATLTHDRSGLKVVPAVGNLDATDQAAKVYKLLARLRTAIARKERSI